MRSKAIVAITKFVLWVLIFCCLFILVASGFSCSAVQDIQQNSSQIDTLSRSSEVRFETIVEASNQDEVIATSKEGIKEQQEIQNSVSNIRNVLPKVVDKKPSWLETIDSLLWVGMLMAIIILLWQTGIGSLLKRAIFSISFFIPTKAKKQVEMDLKVADEENPMTMREVIAHRRSDPAYDSAYKKTRRS